MGGVFSRPALPVRNLVRPALFCAAQKLGPRLTICQRTFTAQNLPYPPAVKPGILWLRCSMIRQMRHSAADQRRAPDKPKGKPRSLPLVKHLPCGKADTHRWGRECDEYKHNLDYRATKKPKGKLFRASPWRVTPFRETDTHHWGRVYSEHRAIAALSKSPARLLSRAGLCRFHGLEAQSATVSVQTRKPEKPKGKP
jgi:hypothetical protein